MSTQSGNKSAVMFCLAVVLFVLGVCYSAVADTTEFNLDFSANQSLWQGGPTAGFDVGGSFGTVAGIRYEATASTGAVAAKVNGVLQVQHPDVLPRDTVASIELRYDGDLDGGALDSDFGASVSVEAFIPCVVPTPFGCLHPRTVSLLDEGFFLNPTTGFTPALGTPTTVSDLDNAIGIGPHIDLIIGELGAEVNVDVAQSITLTPTALHGLLRYENRDTGEIGTMPFSIDAASTAGVTTDALVAGMWDFAMIELSLNNQSRNDINLDIRPTINYIIGEWPPPGSPLFSVGLLDETFPLDFRSFSIVDAFTVQVIPEPKAVYLLAMGLVGLVGLSRTRLSC